MTVSKTVRQGSNPWSSAKVWKKSNAKLVPWWGRGEIGRRTGFRFQRREVWEFESLRPHHHIKARLMPCFFITWNLRAVFLVPDFCCHGWWTSMRSGLKLSSEWLQGQGFSKFHCIAAIIHAICIFNNLNVIWISPMVSINLIYWPK